jgi:recombination protein RecA
MTKHIPDVIEDTSEDIARWQEPLKALAPARESSPITGSTIPTGLPTLDIALGGGLLRGRIVEIFGLQGAGKSTVTYHTVANAQRIGGVCVLVAIGNSELHLGYAQDIGVDGEKLLLAQVKSVGEALRLAELLADSGLVDVVVVDSLTTAMPSHPIEATQDDSPAHMTSQAMRKLSRHMHRTQTLCLITSQTLVKFGGMFPHPGGYALKSYSSQRLHVKNLGMSSESCTRVQVKVIKNPEAPPFQTATLDIHPGKGGTALHYP